MSDKFKKVSEVQNVDELKDGDYIISVVNGKICKNTIKNFRKTIITTYEFEVAPGQTFEIPNFGMNGLFMLTDMPNNSASLYFKTPWDNDKLLPIGSQSKEIKTFIEICNRGNLLAIVNNHTYKTYRLRIDKLWSFF